MNQLTGKQVSLKDQPQYVGRVRALHLKANADKNRKQDLYLVDWTRQATRGIVEPKDLIVIDDEDSNSSI